jgi:hypothetical protein
LAAGRRGVGGGLLNQPGVGRAAPVQPHQCRHSGRQWRPKRRALDLRPAQQHRHADRLRRGAVRRQRHQQSGGDNVNRTLHRQWVIPLGQTGVATHQLANGFGSDAVLAVDAAIIILGGLLLINAGRGRNRRRVGADRRNVGDAPPDDRQRRNTWQPGSARSVAGNSRPSPSIRFLSPTVSAHCRPVITPAAPSATSEAKSLHMQLN